jgi:hypothetical protein
MEKVAAECGVICEAVVFLDYFKDLPDPRQPCALAPGARVVVFGQVKVAEKSIKIIVIPALLDMMAIEGAIVTIDAMGCQRDIAATILDKKADYFLALKGNQGTLREDIEVFAAEQ